jgi:hypothetical protein
MQLALYGHRTMSCAQRQSAQDGHHPQQPSLDSAMSQVSRSGQSTHEGKWKPRTSARKGIL